MHTARTTAGQALAISYDAVTNTVHFREYDWHADQVRSGGAAGTTPLRRRTASVIALTSRRRQMRRSRAA